MNGVGNDASASNGNKSSIDPFLANDFYPLNQAHNAVLGAMRADESAPDADLSRRISSGSNATAASDIQGHTYRTSQDRDHLSNGATSSERFGGAMPTQMQGNVSVSANVNANLDKSEVYNTLSHTNSVPLPPYLTNIIKETKLSSLMGILPEGNMVWVSVDNSLYLWEYGSLSGGRKKEDFVCFKVPSGQCVVSVGIVKPKPGE